MKRNIIIGLIVTLVLGAMTYSAARWEKLYQPIFLGGTSGSEFQIVIDIDSTMAAQDHWCLGDTTFDGAYEPEHSFRIMDIKLMGTNFNTGDTCGINVWAVNEDDTSSEIIIVPSDCLYVNASIDSACIWVKNMTDSLSGTYEIIKHYTQNVTTGEERLGIQYNYIAGTPDHVKVILECKTQFNENLE